MPLPDWLKIYCSEKGSDYSAIKFIVLKTMIRAFNESFCHAECFAGLRTSPISRVQQAFAKFYVKLYYFVANSDDLSVSN